MARKLISKTEYVVTGIGYCVGGDIELARIQAKRAGKLRSDIWNKYGGLQAWGINSNQLVKEFKLTNPPEKYELDYEQWEKAFQRCIDEIHTYQEAVKTSTIRRIYQKFSEEGFRDELVKSLNSLEWMQYPLINRWVRQYYHRGHTWKNNQINVTDRKKYPIVKRISRNVVEVTINGDLIKPRQYQKIKLRFKVGRITPTGNLRIMFNDETGNVELHYSRIIQKVENSNTSLAGLDKGYTEALTDSDGIVYGDGIGKVMTREVKKRHVRGKARNKLYAVAKNKNKKHILRCNLGKKRWNKREKKKKNRLKNCIREGVNKFFDSHKVAVTEDLSATIKSKRRSRARNRQLSEWCKGEIQKALEEISQRRKSSVVLVNAAYSSQVDCRNGTLLGHRDGDSFFTFDGMELQADRNAAVNLLQRKDDTEITRFMKVDAINSLLLRRTASFLAQMDLTLQDAVDLGWLDSKHLERYRRGKHKAKDSCLVV